MPLHLISGPVAEPLTLAEAKNHLRVDDAFTADDAYITGLISAVREYAEHLTQAHFVTQQWQQIQDSFGHYTFNFGGLLSGKQYSLPSNAILLQKGPVVSVDSIDYLDTARTPRTMPATDYTVDLYGSPARITPQFGKIWPIPLPEINAVKITFTTGYGNAAAVPAGLKHWMKIRLDTLYNHRGEEVVVKSGTIQHLPHVDRLLDPYRQAIY